MAKVHVYQSCTPIVQMTNKKTQVIQTEKLVNTNIIGTIVKDKNNYCWYYLGEFESSYIPPTDVFSIKYSGNFFKSQILPIFSTEENCLITKINECQKVYYNAIRCDNNDTVVVSVCNYNVENSTIKFLPDLGQICGIYNSNGDDFCVTIISQSDVIETNYEIITPFWYDFNCTTCPLYKSYTVSSCNNMITGITMYDGVNNTIVPNNNTIIMNGTCYIINSYDGIVCDYRFGDIVFPTIVESFGTCNDCFIKLYNG